MHISTCLCLCLLKAETFSVIILCQHFPYDLTDIFRLYLTVLVKELRCILFVKYLTYSFSYSRIDRTWHIACLFLNLMTYRVSDFIHQWRSNLYLDKFPNLLVQFCVTLHSFQHIIHTSISLGNRFPTIVHVRTIRLDVNTLFLQIHQLPSRFTVVLKGIRCLTLYLSLFAVCKVKTVYPLAEFVISFVAHLTFHGRITLCISIGSPRTCRMTALLVNKGRRSDKGYLSKLIVPSLVGINHSQRRIGESTQFQNLSQFLLRNVMHPCKSLFRCRLFTQRKSLSAFTFLSSSIDRFPVGSLHICHLYRTDDVLHIV